VGVIDILLIKHNGNFYALGSTHTYDGETELFKGGVVFGNKLLAPKHGTAYNIETGRIEDGPGSDSLPIFKTLVEDGQVKVMLPKKAPIKIKPQLSSRDYNDPRKLVVIGGGEAAMACAEALRNLEYNGELMFLTDDKDLPIYRDKLYNTIKYVNYEKLKCMSSKDARNAGIDVVFDAKIRKMDAKNKKAFIITDDNQLFEYDACLVATDSFPNIPYKVKGFDHTDTNVSTFYTVDDHKKVRSALENGAKNLVYLG